MTAHHFLKAAQPDSSNTLEALSPQERIEWAIDQHGDRLVLTTSFGIQAAVLLHMATNIKPDIPVIFVDTGYLHPETHLFREALTERLRLNLRTYSPSSAPEADDRPWEKGELALKAFNHHTKVEPLNRALQDLGATGWISGLRHGQNERRANLGPVEIQNGIVKVYPIIDLSKRDVHKYLAGNQLPYHPLFYKGYSTVGNYFENGPGQERQECGIHVQ